MDGYTACLNQSQSYLHESNNITTSASSSSSSSILRNSISQTSLEIFQEKDHEKQQKLVFLKEVRGEVLLRIAILKKEMGNLEQSLQMCNQIQSEPFSDTLKANALCLKVSFSLPFLIVFFSFSLFSLFSGSLFYSILFYSILFCSILFYSVLFASLLVSSLLFVGFIT
jgi:chemotaxis protein CheY-P-specific phosphatase CheC